MARRKNALRVHEIAPWNEAGTKPTEEDYLELSAGIESISDDSDEDVDDTVFYDSEDGTPDNEVIGISEIWSVEGQYDDEDPAQRLIESMKRKLGKARRVWHRITFPNGKVVEGPAKVTGIVAGGGDAGEFSAFACVLNYSRIPDEIEPTEATGAGA